MKKIPAHPSSCDFRPTAITRVCLALAKTTVEGRWQCRNRENTTTADLNRSPWGPFIANCASGPAALYLLQSP
jgi:hypothetical protein